MDIKMVKHQGVAIGAVAAAGFAGLRWLGRTAGATRVERESHLPGDELIKHPMMVTTHAITIDAPPGGIWPWLVQMGWHRGQWYTARWVDRLLFPGNAPSADRIVTWSSVLGCLLAPWGSGLAVWLWRWPTRACVMARVSS